MFCYNCGASQPDGTTFCSNCGRSTQAPPRPLTSAQTSASPTPGIATQAATSLGSASAAQPAPATPASGAASTSPWLNVPPMAQPAGQPVYSGQPVYRGQAQTDGKATASFVLGILTALLCFNFLTGVPAVVLGHLSRKSIRESMGRLKGDGMALAGLIMGYISIAIIPVLIIAAIAIPNLLRAKISANDSAAASTIRILNTAQVTYATEYPAKGYARDLATLGSGAEGSCSSRSETNACLIDDVLAKQNVKRGFRFNMTAVCGDNDECKDYVVTAIPLTNATGSRSFCSTSDAVIRYKRGSAFPPSTVEGCQAWPPLV